MNDVQYRAFLDLMMCSDPWPIDGESGKLAHATLVGLADNEARARKFADWIVAYHEFKPTTTTTVPPSADALEPESEPADPVAAAIARRARDLSYALTPRAIGEKLQKELEAIVGKEAAVVYQIRAKTTNGRDVEFEVARLGPRLLARVTGSVEKGAKVDVAWRAMTGGGWRVAVGVAASVDWGWERPAGATVAGEFVVTLKR
jgi:hypothetical protein